MNEDNRTLVDEAVEALQRRLTAVGGVFELLRLPDGSRRFRTGVNTLGEVYQRARLMGDRPLLVTFEKNARTAELIARRTSYEAIFAPAMELAAVLRARGFAGRRIALLLDDGAEWLTWFVAITAAGASCVLPPPDSSDELIGSCLESAHCQIVVSSSGRVFAAMENVYSITTSGTDGSEQPMDPDSEALVVFTSGSSGTPKGVIHSHRSLLSGLRNMMLGGALSSACRPKASSAPMRPQLPSAVVLSPLAYIAGYSAFLMSISGGGRIVLARNLPDELVALIIEQEGAQSITGASAELLRRLIRLQNAATQLRSLRRLQLHGEGLRRGLVEEIEMLLPEIQLITGYGLTETAGSIATAAVRWVIETADCCGPVLPSVDVRIVGKDGDPVSSGEVGDIQVRGAMLLRGYLDPARTAAALTSDGWFRTGDAGSVDRRGWINVVDRGNRMLAMAFGDERYCASIEEAMRAIAGVDDAVVAVSDDRHDIAVYLQPKAGADVDTGAIRSLLAARAQWSGPVHIRTFESLPRTASGKVARSALAASSR